MGRPRSPTLLRRGYRFELSVDRDLRDDITEVARQWDVPPSTAAYWLLKGLMAEAHGNTLVVTGDNPSERLARWLTRTALEPRSAS